VFFVTFELPAASVPWRGGSSVTPRKGAYRKTQMTACQYKKLQIQMIFATV